MHMDRKGYKMIERLREKNHMMIHNIHDESFQSYGREVTGYDFDLLISYMEEFTEIPPEGNVYVPSIEKMEQMKVSDQIRNTLYGGMPIEIEYCNGKNSTYNGFEYHKGSEINIAVTDFMLVLGHSWDIEYNTYKADKAQVFFVEKGTAIEMFQTTLHLSPCKVNDEGFKDIVILPQGTNTPLVQSPGHYEEEDRLLLLTNKWVIAHPEREPLIRQGAHPGVLGENKELLY